MNNKIILIIILISVGACSSLKRYILGEDQNLPNLSNYSLYKSNDYIDHLSSLGQEYLNSPNVKTIALSKLSQAYLEKIYNKIINSNETLLNSNTAPKIYIIKDATPFYFSLPGPQFFFSLGLIKKYFEYEELLVSALTHEIIKSHRNLYNKKIIVPVGYLGTERLLNIVRIDTDKKIGIDKWTFYAMKRAGYDSFAYLNWLQVQNKNTLDFTMQIGDSQRITREEFQFKYFIVQEGLANKDSRNIEMNSSKDFYYFINEMKRHNL